MKRKAVYVTLLTILSIFLLTPAGLAKRDLEDEVQAFTVAERAFYDHFYDFARQRLERFLEYHPRSEKFGEAKLLLGRTYLELDRPYESLEQFLEMLREDEFETLRDQVLYWTGELHLRGKNFSTAVNTYKRLIDGYPESPMFPYAVYSLAWCEEGKGRFEEAAAGYAELIQRFPGHLLAEEAHVRRTVCLLRQKKFDETLTSCRIFMETYPTSPWKGEILYLQGELFFEQEQFQKAIPFYEEALLEKKEKPWRSRALLHQGWSHLKLGAAEKALPIFQTLTEKEEVGEAAHFGVILSRRLQGNQEEVLKALESFLDRPLPPEWRSKALLEKGEILLGLSRYPEAIESFQTLLSRFPSAETAVQAHYNLGWAYLRQGETEEAISEFQWVAQRASEVPLRVQAILRIGDLYQDQKAWGQAIEQYQRVLNEFPFALQADYAAHQIALCHLRAKDYSTAIRAYQNFLSTYATSRYRGQAYYDLGLTHFYLGDFTSAKKAFEEAVASEPTEELRFSSRFQMGSCLYNLKDYAAALAIFQEIAEKGPDRFAAMARYEMGWCFYQMGKRKEAVSSFQEYLSKYPDSDIAPDIHFWFAEYYERQKQTSRSEKYLKQLVESFPKHPLADEALLRWSEIVSEKNPGKAVELLDQLVTQYPGSSLRGEALLQKGELLLSSGKESQTRELLEQVLVQFPDSEFEKQAARRIADLLKEKGQYAEAIAYFKRAKTGDAYEPNAQIQFEIGECYEALGEFESALEEFLRIAALYPKSTYWVMRSYLKGGALFEKQGRWKEAVETYEKLAGWHRLEEAKVARERLQWIQEQILTTQKTP